MWLNYDRINYFKENWKCAVPIAVMGGRRIILTRTDSRAHVIVERQYRDALGALSWATVADYSVDAKYIIDLSLNPTKFTEQPPDSFDLDEGLIAVLVLYFTTPDKGKNPLLLTAVKALKGVAERLDEAGEDDAANDLTKIITIVEDANNATYVPATPAGA